MKLLHTSDWHLGQTLYGRKRHEEFERLLQWLVALIDERHIDALLVAGDVFDTTVPGYEVQKLYYRFLSQLARSSCRHVIITAGNHDSPTFLEAPRELLRGLDVHVIGSITDRLDDEVLVLRDRSGQVEAVVCAVPFLRDRDVRTVEAGETAEQKQHKLMTGIRDHYQAVCQYAEAKRHERQIPLIVMGHLLAAGGQTYDGDGVRELYIGSLVQLPATLFPDAIDYLALGHLHLPQRVGGSETRRYSGAPLAMGLGESQREKQVVLVQFSGRAAQVSTLSVPCFQDLEQVRGDWDDIVVRLEQLRAEQSSAWLEVIYEGNSLMPDLRDRLQQILAGSDLLLLRTRNHRLFTAMGWDEQQTLDELSHREVFLRCLDRYQIPDEQRPDLLAAYDEISLTDAHSPAAL
ncbi:MAG: exonuclease SbcCD subunit D C-terminal domain-containing protein [Magnetococcales bacterium]|nr:exonuclease SbcCD subunit D C-terminal domain-containing protein [Magnetococcales bacterium]